MNWGRILSAANMILAIGAAIGFWYAGERRKALYWLFAAGINSTFVF